ncbi:MAG: PhoD-like phosphatase N-terminal domain-containing protein, partial [Pirellulaceae bacterium]
MRLTIILLVCGILLPFTSPVWAEIYRAQGEMVGEVTMTSAILQARLTAVPRIVEGQVPGAAGVARFEYAENADFEPSQSSDWIEAKPEQDYLVKTVLTGLKPATQYHYRLIFGENPDQARIGPTGTFRTLQGAEGTEPVRFVVVTGMHYGRFHGLKRGYRGPNPDRAEGFPALAVMAEMDLDFFVGTGDNVYYDHD